jgi:SAM-dependent methyltransferase
VLWVAKAAFQKGLSAVPRGEGVNYALQRYVTRKLPPPEQRLRWKFSLAVRHLEAFEQHGPRRGVSDALFYEFGAGWDLAVPLSLWALGVERQLLVDVRPNLRLALVNVTLERLERLGAELGQAAGRELRIPEAPVASHGQLEQCFGISYRAPCDARRTGLGSASVDFVFSTDTLEHVPVEDVVPLLRECKRLLRPNGALSAVIDLSDHYSYADSSISRYNFLRYSDRVWRLANSRLQHQNRLRRPDYLEAFEAAGLEVVSEKSWRPEAQLKSLRALQPASRFDGYTFEDLAVQRLRLVARVAGSTEA